MYSPSGFQLTLCFHQMRKKLIRSTCHKMQTSMSQMLIHVTRMESVFIGLIYILKFKLRLLFIVSFSKLHKYMYAILKNAYFAQAPFRPKTGNTISPQHSATASFHALIHNHNWSLLELYLKTNDLECIFTKI